MNKYPSSEVKYTYEMEGLNGFALTVPDDVALSDLRSIPEIEYAEHEKFGEQYAVQKGAPWNLARVCQKSLRHLDYYYDDDAGKNADIYILDSGVRVTHADLAGRVILGGAFTGETGVPKNGHGTSVASIAAGTKYGVAKKAQVISVRVIDNDGFIAESDAIAGIQWAMGKKQQRNRPSVMNFSWGMYQSEALKTAIQAARKKGFTMVAAAGNNFNVDACHSYPSGLPDVITVGATDLSDSRYGAFGKCIDVFAPGVSITGAHSSGDTATMTWTGTSQASPHVAGYAAIVLSDNISYQSWQVEDKIIAIATKQILKNLGPLTPNNFLYNNPPASAQEHEEIDEEEQIIFQ